MKSILNFNVRTLCFVLAMLVVQCAFAQDRTITGTVTDNKQEPLIGVNVVVKGNASVGAITDLDGKYSLSVPAGKATLVFSYIGYLSQEITVEQQSTINVVLKDCLLYTSPSPRDA